jgi:hypothetical protein
MTFLIAMWKRQRSQCVRRSEARSSRVLPRTSASLKPTCSMPIAV